MKKRILSILLSLVMVLTLLPTQVIADEASECAHCSHIHWGSYVCEDCGLCSDECSNSDCWYETHCKNCGACYMKADDWCDECGWCKDCMDNEAHCKDCGRCFLGESKDDLCENCGLCSYHFDRGICSDCNLCDDCAGDEHCPYCPDDPNHLDGGEPCGACEDCALELGFHCEVCGACFEDGADHCPVHPDGNHCDDTSCTGFVCEECERCAYEDGIDECDTCHFCKDCCEEKSIDAGCYTGELCADDPDFETEDHFCPECNHCYHEFDKCADCGHCENCCFDDEVSCAAGCTCASTEPPTRNDHTHKFKPGVYTGRNATDHAQKCLICEETVTEAHAFTAAGKCEKCGWDKTQSLFFVTQPKNATAPVSWADAPETDPSHPNNNKVTFSATAVNQIGKDILSYEWYQVKKDKKNNTELDKTRVSFGADNTTVSVSVPADACIYSYEYYCVVTSRDADERVIQEKSATAALRTKHNYGGDLVASDLYDLKKVKSISIITDDGVRYGPYAQGSEYHNKFCRGEECYHPQRSVGTRHNFVFERALGHGYNAAGAGRPEASREYFYSYLWKCSDCGHLELRTSSTELDNTTFEYQITFENTAGAYAEDGNKITRITAQPGEKMYAIAPAKDADGNAFKEWRVVSPGGVTITSSPDGRGEFTMPASHIRLKAFYYTDSKAATSIDIVEGVGFGFRPVNESLTIEVGDEIKLYVKLTPDTGLASTMVVWDVLYADASNPQLIFMEESASATSNTTSEPVDGEHGVKLEAKAPGFVRVRAATQNSGGTLYDTITVRILPAPGSGDTSHDHHTFDSGTVVPPTCTKIGYTVYKCTYAGCDYQFRNDFKNPTGHKDDDGNGFCDTCNYQLGNDGNTSMVGLTKINKVELTIAAPGRGGVPSTVATPTGSEKDCFTVATVMWDPSVTGGFAGGTKYTVLIKLETVGDYGFKLNGIVDSNNTQFYINGNKATVVYRDAQQASISYQFPATINDPGSSGSGSSSGTGTGSGSGSSGAAGATPVKAPRTGDPGVMLYAAMGLLSLSGGAWIVGKKRKDK